jgi:uncharacterized protein
MSNRFKLIALLVALTLGACKKDPPPIDRSLDTTPPRPATTKKKILVDTASIYVEIADDEMKREQGLMFRKSMPENEGMLFVFDSPAPRSFWMKNCLMPIDVAYIDAQGKIVNIVQMPVSPSGVSDNDLPTYPSTAPAKYALETAKDWFQKRGIKSGASVKF